MIDEGRRDYRSLIIKINNFNHVFGNYGEVNKFLPTV